MKNKSTRLGDYYFTISICSKQKEIKELKKDEEELIELGDELEDQAMEIEEEIIMEEEEGKQIGFLLNV